MEPIPQADTTSPVSGETLTPIATAAAELAADQSDAATTSTPTPTPPPRPRPKLDERAFRRPDFAGGVPVRLGDGQEWTLPVPILRFVPVEGGGGDLVFGHRRRTLGPKFDSLFEAMVAGDDEDEEGKAHAALNLAALLVRHNYDLPVAHLQALLPCDPDSDENGEMWQRIIDVAMGNSPKV